MSALGGIVEKLVKDARISFENERKATEKQHAMVSHTAAQEIKRLKYQNAHLTELLDAERKNATLARDNLVKNISSLLGAFAEERDKSLREVVGVAQLSNGAAGSALESFSKTYESSVAENAARNKMWAANLDKAAVEGSQSKLTATEVRMFLVPVWLRLIVFAESPLCQHVDAGGPIRHAFVHEQGCQRTFRRNHRRVKDSQLMLEGF